MLTRADALAYETLPREIMGWRRILLFLWAGSGGMAVAFLPEGWVGGEGSLRFWAILLACVAIQFGLATAAMTAWAYVKAARRLPRPVAVTMLDHVDRLEWQEQGVISVFASETIGPVIQTLTHLFVHAGGRVLILPVRTFDGMAAMSAFANELDKRIID
ncbi:hypothetical protein [Kaistia nematophila]|uniref:Uncharacterized protein n=1 Tax=Kaistia nematophila TaxID=2994654 RepID=A0A9X3DZD1_9HYPH|nr:hypothetical protein [Kaistia nematophila]MCX5568133.1 hypothetical protein [Kaistia nematophila]